MLRDSDPSIRKPILIPPYLQHVDKDHGVGDVAVELLLLGHVGQIDKSPGHDSGTAVEEKLEVKPLADAGVELDAHHEVVEDVPCELAAGPQKKVTAVYQHLIQN